MNNYERLEGMVAATFTPMDENGDVNLSVIEKYADWIASTPIKGVFVCGTTGEFSSLTIDERKLILEKWVASAGKRFKVIAHVGSNCQRSAMELACHAEKAVIFKPFYCFVRFCSECSHSWSKPKTIFIRIFRVLHTVQFSRNFVLLSLSFSAATRLFYHTVSGLSRTF